MSRSEDKLPKLIFLGCLALAGLSGAFLYGMLAQKRGMPPAPQVHSAFDILTGEKSPEFDGGIGQHLQPSRGQGEGVVVNDAEDTETMIFMAGFFDGENQGRLIQRDGTVVRKWSLDYFELFPDSEARACKLRSALMTDTDGALLTPQGEMVFTFEYCGAAKLDQCGEPIWTVNTKTHHAMAPSEAGGYLLMGRHQWKASDEPDRFPPFSSPGENIAMQEDTLLWLGEDGSVLEEVSIPQLMIDGGLEAVLTANGDRFVKDKVSRRELVHANKVAELSSEIADQFPFFEAGDLAISLRKLNLVMVIDRETKRIKWHQVGPWLRQHDPEFRSDGWISIFNNNVYIDAYFDGEKTDLNSPFKTNIIAVNPVTGETEVTFGERPGQEMLSVIRGQHELLDNGGILINEFDAGRVLEVDAAGRIVWDYINAYDDENVGEITAAVAYPPEYFETEWRSCE